MRGPALTFALLALAGAAAAQVTPSRPTSLEVQRQIGLDAARAQQQGFGVSLQLQALNAAQARQLTQQTLQSLQAARPTAPLVVPEFAPGGGTLRRLGQQSAVVSAPITASPSTPSDPGASTRGDLPL